MGDKEITAKSFGRVYTPTYLVEIILDFVGYRLDILQKHIIDNSCGDGAFLVTAVERYCEAFFQSSSDKVRLKEELETYIHGIEIDCKECALCKQNLDKVALRFHVSDVDWDVVCANTLTQKQFNGRMDFVVGNPPYVRVHNLEDTYEMVKAFSFAQGGMTDLFIVFFEIGFQMLSAIGRMCIITPSSWLTSGAGKVLRDYICRHHNLSGVVDLGHYQAFDATTYTLISRYDRVVHNAIDYLTFDGQLHPHGTLNYSDFNINNSFYLSDKAQLHVLFEIQTSLNIGYAKVKNGFATLADNVFIGDFSFSNFTIDILKASTGKWQKCVFPYDNQGKPLSEAVINGSEAYSYLLSKKERLLHGRDIEAGKPWFLFGRTQALNDVGKNKIAINTIIKDLDSIKLNVVPAGKGVYSGLYILTELDFHVVRRIILSEDFLQYIKSLKKYKSGGYYTFSSKDLELFINYQIQNKND